MPDHFARLGVPPAPWIDPEILKQKFFALSGETHPDKAAAAKAEAENAFRELNESYQLLRNTRSRLLHFLELQGVRAAGRVQAVPASALEFFAPVAELAGRAGALLKEKPAIQSPMLKAQHFEKAITCAGELQALQSRVQARIAGIEQQIRQWSGGDLRQLEECAAALGFLERWNAQLQELSVALAY